MKIEKKYIIAGGLAVVSVGLAYAYWQYQKLMQYCLSFNSVKIKTVSPQNIDFDLYLNFKNKSSHDLVVKNQSYSVFLNNIQIAQISNANVVNIKANATTPIGINIVASDISSKIETNLLDILAKGLNNEITVNVKLMVKYMMFRLPVTYTYSAKLSDLTKPKQQTSDKKC
jgi:LEA14-like dessication related protein